MVSQEQKEILYEIMKQNYQDFDHSLTLDDLKISKLTGLTNETFRVQNLKTGHSTIVRMFGFVGDLIDGDKEHMLFLKLGENDMGPKCYGYCRSKWRIEQFVENGEHPTIKELSSSQFYRQFAIYLAKFHSIEMIQDYQSPIIYNYFNSQRIEIVNQKSRDHTGYRSERIEKMQELAKLFTSEELQEVKKFIPKEDTVRMCHNDLNPLNLFKLDCPNKRILFIDFEYAGTNYISYDIANFMNETTIDYQISTTPGFQYVPENEFDEAKIKDFVIFYSLGSIFIQKQDLENWNNLSKLLNEDNKIEIQEFLNQHQGLLNDQDIDRLVLNIRKSLVICNWYWTMWSILSSLPEPTGIFDHLDHGIHRKNRYEALKQQLQGYIGN